MTTTKLATIAARVESDHYNNQFVVGKTVCGVMVDVGRADALESPRCSRCGKTRWECHCDDFADPNRDEGGEGLRIAKGGG